MRRPFKALADTLCIYKDMWVVCRLVYFSRYYSQHIIVLLLKSGARAFLSYFLSQFSLNLKLRNRLMSFDVLFRQIIKSQQQSIQQFLKAWISNIFCTACAKDLVAQLSGKDTALDTIKYSDLIKILEAQKRTRT